MTKIQITMSEEQASSLREYMCESQLYLRHDVLEALDAILYGVLVKKYSPCEFEDSGMTIERIE